MNQDRIDLKENYLKRVYIYLQAMSFIFKFILIINIIYVGIFKGPRSNCFKGQLFKARLRQYLDLSENRDYNSGFVTGVRIVYEGDPCHQTRAFLYRCQIV